MMNHQKFSKSFSESEGYTAGVRLRSAQVQRISGTTYFVADACSLVRAERSVSCLLQPEQDDLVLISEDSMGNVSILTVLERKGGATGNGFCEW